MRTSLWVTPACNLNAAGFPVPSVGAKGIGTFADGDVRARLGNTAGDCLAAGVCSTAGDCLTAGFDMATGARFTAGFETEAADGGLASATDSRG